jgi:prepilin-type N-terminal cleavage/methylation domain-containing protein
MMRPPPPPGTTLLELIVVLALIGILSAMSALGMQAVRPRSGNTWAAGLSHARMLAITGGQPINYRADSIHGAVRLLPDGRAIGLDVEPLTGREARAAR